MAILLKKIIQINFLLSAAVFLFLIMHLSQWLKEHPSETGSVPYLWVPEEEEDWPPPADSIVMDYMITLVIEAGVVAIYLSRSRFPNQAGPRTLAGFVACYWMFSAFGMPLLWHDAYKQPLVWTNSHFTLVYVCFSHLAYAFLGDIPGDSQTDDDN